MASLVADVDEITGAQNNTARCRLRQKWASLGADFTSIRFYNGANAEVKSGAGAVFSAGKNVYAVFGSISPAKLPIDTTAAEYPPVAGAQVNAV
jgi:hypothetical protein